MKELYTTAELKRLISQGEGQFIEFKSLWDLKDGQRKALSRRAVRDFVAEYVAAFANADGGVLLLGVDDDGTPSGHSYPDEAVRDIIAVPERRLRPVMQIDVQKLSADGHKIIVFQIPIAPEAVMVDGDGFPYRVGKQVIHEPQEVINQRKQAYRRVGYEQQVRPEAAIDDIDLALAEEFLGKTPYAGRPVLDILRNYGLIIPRGNSFAVTNAALLLFCKAPSVRWHSRSGLRIFRVDGTERRHGAQRNVAQQAPLSPPIARMLPEAYKAVASQIGKSEKLHNLFFREMPEYPTFAWQEALVNAVAHRDYNEQGREIEVWFFDERMEIQSPGELVPPVTIDKLKSRKRIHASRNPLMVRVLVDIGIMREEGEGIPRIFDEMEASLLCQPEFSLETSTFCITLRNDPVYAGHSPIWGMLVERFRLGVNQKRVLLAHPEGFSNEAYRKLTGVDRDQAYREIQELVTLGILDGAPVTGRGAVYRVAPALKLQRDWLTSRVPKLITYFGAHGELTNRDFCRLQNLTRFVATRELKRLVDDGYLILSGTGRGAHYLPGPGLAGFLKK